MKNVLVVDIVNSISSGTPNVIYKYKEFHWQWQAMNYFTSMLHTKTGRNFASSDNTKIISYKFGIVHTSLPAMGDEKTNRKIECHMCIVHSKLPEPRKANENTRIQTGFLYIYEICIHNIHIDKENRTRSQAITIQNKIDDGGDTKQTGKTPIHTITTD